MDRLSDGLMADDTRSYLTRLDTWQMYFKGCKNEPLIHAHVSYHYVVPILKNLWWRWVAGAGVEKFFLQVTLSLLPFLNT